MREGFDPGIVRELAFEVTEEMCPDFDGVVVHRCCSTWTMVHQMEIAARMVLVDFLDDDEEGIGSHISVDHLSPIAVGRTARVRAELTEVSGNRVVCEVTAYEGDRLLAKGRQVQVVMSKQRLRRHLERW